MFEVHLRSCSARKKFLAEGGTEHICKYHKHHIYLNQEQLIFHELFECKEPLAAEHRKQQEEKRAKERRLKLKQELSEEHLVFAPSSEQVLQMWEQSKESQETAFEELSDSSNESYFEV